MDTSNQDAFTGFVLIDKPKDWTSHDVVGYLRKITNIKKIGHAGTLDPFATGLLIVGIGRPATKRIDEFKNLNKVYRADIFLGAKSTTDDPEGEITYSTDVIPPNKTTIENTLKEFMGHQTQIPPMYSAKKVAGKKLYDLARKGIEIERKPHEITIYAIKFLSYSFPTLSIEITCSTGTYIRTIAHDIGEKLKIGAYCTELRRTAIGSYSIDNAFSPKKLTKKLIAANFIDVDHKKQ